MDQRLLTLARDLKRRKARERQALFVAEGVRTVEELLRSPLVIRGVLATAAGRTSPRGKAAWQARSDIARLEVDDAALLSAADTEHPQGILAVAEIPSHTLASLSLAATVRLLVLDGLQDPGNVGTLVRTGAALGATAIVALPGTADLWNAKVVRSAAGAHFRMPLIHCTAEALLSFLREQDVAVWGTAADGLPLGTVTPPPRLALVMGNEGAGMSDQLRAAADRMVALPMAAGVESLNVAVAAGIILYALRP